MKARKSPQWIPPSDLDKECLELCVAMNKLPGIRTTNSCCGHGDQPEYAQRENQKELSAIPAAAREALGASPPAFIAHPFWIFFAVDDPECLLPLLYWMQTCHSEVKGKWHVEVYTDCAGDKVFWMLEGPVGAQAYEDARVIAQKLEGIANIRRLERKRK